jgi:hypothetical protein
MRYGIEIGAVRDYGNPRVLEDSHLDWGSISTQRSLATRCAVGWVAPI